MFFNLVRKNSKRNRKENGLFFASLVVAIVAFYIILSLKSQDVMIFLEGMESDAVSRLLLMIPVLYGFSLFILFFLVYFAEKYQLDRRNHEFGIYLMMGMGRPKMLLMLLAEEVWNSLLSLAVGIPIAIFLSEIISLITARVVGLGIIGHHFTFSFQAVLGTVGGYLVIRLLALTILSSGIMRKEIDHLLADKQKGKQKTQNKYLASIQGVAGMIIILAAFANAIFGTAWERFDQMGLTMAAGIGGVMLFFRGSGVLFEMLSAKKRREKGVGFFTFRQLQENVFLQPYLLAVASLLVFMGICCFGFGVSVALGSDQTETHVLDYTFYGKEKEIKEELEKASVLDDLKLLSEIKINFLGASEDGESKCNVKPLLNAIKKQEGVQEEPFVNYADDYFSEPYLISLSGYNDLLKLQGEKPIHLDDNEIVFYVGQEDASAEISPAIENALKERPEIELAGKQYRFAERGYQGRLVADRAIVLNYGLIVTNRTLEKLTDQDGYSYWNGVLKSELVKKDGLMQAVTKVNKKLDQTPLEHESYLQNMGRQLFYGVATSYITIYLAVIFLIIANTIIGVRFLMQQQKTKGRYQTLTRLGCHYEMLCQSARKQIRWYFGLPVIVAAIGSIFGIRALFSGMLSTAMAENIQELLTIAGAMILLLCVIESIYMTAVARLSDKHLLNLMDDWKTDG